ncbi:hypothetical protein V8E36_006534 [Tilletia maclaganii]
MLEVGGQEEVRVLLPVLDLDHLINITRNELRRQQRSSMEETTFIPVTDAGKLEARIYDPSTSLRGGPQPSGLAIIAHPYGSLGGCFDDHVVCALAELLMVKRHIQVVTFNSRGVGSSTGKASWTGATECEDYQRVVDWATARFEARYPTVQDASLILCGYSAGSLYCSTAQAPPSMLSGRTWAKTGPLYILISYPRGVLWALSLFQSSTYDRALQRLSDTSAKSRALILHGGKDSFTSRKTYDLWTSKLTSDRRITVECIDDADHFWASRAMLQRLVARVDDWLLRQLRVLPT